MSIRPLGVRALLCGLALCIGIMGSANAASTWLGGTDSNWSTAANWSTPPAAGADVILTGAGAFRPTNQDIVGLSINSLTFDATATVAFTVGGSPLIITSAGNAVTVDPASAAHTIAVN